MLMFTILRAVLVRLLFAVHGLLSIWRLYMVVQEIWCLYLLVALGGLLLEAIITIYSKRGKEWKWFCPSVFFYLASVVPAIWFLELHEMETRIMLKENINATLWRENETAEDLSMTIDQLGLEINIPLALSSDLWLRVIEQFLLLMLILGRWMLPKGALSHDQLSQLLLVYVGTAADIVEFYEAFSEDRVKYNRLLCYIVLGIWTLSLLQFTLVLTATRARRDQSGVSAPVASGENVGCCKPEMYGIMISIALQDLPFLVVRLLLIFRHKVVSYTNMFFTSKNSLVILLLIYRLCVVQLESKSSKKPKQKSRIRDSRDSEAGKLNLIRPSKQKSANPRPPYNSTSRPQTRGKVSRM